MTLGDPVLNHSFCIADFHRTGGWVSLGKIDSGGIRVKNHSEHYRIYRCNLDMDENIRVAARYWVQKFAAPLNDATKLRHQAIFFMGAGGSGKSFVAHKWLKYMPGEGPGGASRGRYVDLSEGGVGHSITDEERLLSKLDFTNTVKKLQARGFNIELAGDPSKAKIPFRLYTYDQHARERLIPKEEWESTLPPEVLQEVKGLEDLVFSSPRHETPSYFRQPNPDIYKEEIPGYKGSEPGYVHEMSSEMSKAYLEAAFETGDPILIDGTGFNAAKMASQFEVAKSYGYRVTLVFVSVPLTVNQIRNAIRGRTVDPEIVTRQWNMLTKNYLTLRDKVDKARIVDNRNDAFDFRKYTQNKDKINNFISKRTHYASLFELISHEAPKELAYYGKLLSE